MSTGKVVIAIRAAWLFLPLLWAGTGPAAFAMACYPKIMASRAPVVPAPPAFESRSRNSNECDAGKAFQDRARPGMPMIIFARADGSRPAGTPDSHRRIKPAAGGEKEAAAAAWIEGFFRCGYSYRDPGFSFSIRNRGPSAPARQER